LSTKGKLEGSLELNIANVPALKGLRAVVVELLVCVIIEGQPCVVVGVLCHLEFVEVAHSEALVVVSDNCVSWALLVCR